MRKFPFLFFSNFQNKNCKKNNWESLTVCWHLFELSKIGHSFVKRARPWRTRIERGYFSCNGDCERTLCSFSTRQFQRTRNSIYFLRCTQFSTTQVPLFMQSVEKPRSLLVVSRVECVTARHYFIRSCVKQRRWKFLWPVYKIIFFRILYDWHWVSVALKNCTRRDQLKIAGQSDQFGQWRFTENNSVDNGFKFLQFSHFFSFSSKRFLIETSQFK